MQLYCINASRPQYPGLTAHLAQFAGQVAGVRLRFYGKIFLNTKDAKVTKEKKLEKSPLFSLCVLCLHWAAGTRVPVVFELFPPDTGKPAFSDQ